MKSPIKTFENIPQTGFSSTNADVQTKTAIIALRMKGTILLNLFSIFQIIGGANNADKVSFMGVNPYDVLGVISKLYQAAISCNIMPSDSPEEHYAKQVAIDVTRGDMKIILGLLENRMHHCEEERDNRSARFNPDTYIGQKLLLIELKEWLLCDSIIIQEESLPSKKSVSFAGGPKEYKERFGPEMGEGEDGNRADGAHSFTEGASLGEETTNQHGAKYHG
jgi:hypothetical protein